MKTVPPKAGLFCAGFTRRIILQENGLAEGGAFLCPIWQTRADKSGRFGIFWQINGCGMLLETMPLISAGVWK